MSPRDLASQLHAAYLDKLVNHTLTQLDQFERDREDQTPEVEFDGEHPAHSFKFECKQIAACFQSEEVDTLRKMIQDIHYWRTEAYALVEMLMKEVYQALKLPIDDVLDKVKFIDDELAKGTDAVFEIERMDRRTQRAMYQLQAGIESRLTDKTRTASQWQEKASLVYRVAQEVGFSSKHIQKARQDIIDEQYWQCEVGVLKPHRYQPEYNTRQQQSARRQPRDLLPRPALPARSTRVLRARTPSSPNKNPSKRQGGQIAKGCSSTLKPRPELSEPRRSARLIKQLAERRAQGEGGMSH